MIIGIDHGNMQIKTAHCAFVSGCKAYPYNIGMGNILEFGGNYYTLSPERIPYMQDKTKNNKFYILTLFAIAMEIEARKAPRKGEIQLAVGLPPEMYSVSRINAFTRYLNQNSELQFKCNKKSYDLKITDIKCYMQGYSAILSKILDTNASIAKKGCVVDIGGHTVDFIDYRNGDVEPSQLRSFDKGIINLINDIQNSVNASTDYRIREEDIYEVFDGEKSFLPENIKELILEKRDAYAEEVIQFVDEQSIWDLSLTTVYFTGGGTKYLKDYLKNNANIGAAQFIEDIHANAKGYEVQYKYEI